MARFLHAIFVGLVGAGIVHIAVLLLIPAYSQRDAWSTLSEQANFYAVTRLDPANSAPLIGSLDPLLSAAACRFDLSDGPVRMHGAGEVPYWSVSVYDRSGQNVFSFNDTSTPERVLDFVVATPAQMIGLRNDLPPTFEDSVFIEADIGEGIAVVRVFTPDESWEPTITSYLRDLGCAGE
jgi:uncharacterized membrane protein